MKKESMKKWKKILEWWKVMIKKMNEVKTIKISDKIMKMHKFKKHHFFNTCKMTKKSPETWQKLNWYNNST